MTKKITVRPMEPEDGERLLKMIGSIGEKEGKFLALDKKMGVIRRNIRDCRHICVIAEGNEIVGFSRKSDRPDRGAVLEEIYIDDRHRRKGYAQKLLDELDGACDYLLAKIFAGNGPIVRFMEKNGFRAIKRLKTVLHWRKDIK